MSGATTEIQKVQLSKIYTLTNKGANARNNSRKLQEILCKSCQGKHQHHRSKSLTFKKTGKTNIHEKPLTLLKKLELLHPAHTQHCFRGKSPTSLPSTTKQTSTDRDKEIEDLRNQTKLLK